MDINELPVKGMDYEAASKLEDAGYFRCEDLIFIGEGRMRKLIGKGVNAMQLRAAASLAIIPEMTAELVEASLPSCSQSGIIDFIEADPKVLAASINSRIDDTVKHINAEWIITQQEDAAAIVLRLLLEQLCAKGWQTQLAALSAGDDETIERVQGIIRTCGGFKKAKPYLGEIEKYFQGLGGLFGGGAELRRAIEALKNSPDEAETRREKLERDLGTQYAGWPPGEGLHTLIGISREALEQLAAQGIKTVYGLRGANPTQIAARTSLTAEQLSRWRCQADLQARPGITPSLAYTIIRYDEEKKPKKSVYDWVVGEFPQLVLETPSAYKGLERFGRKLHLDGHIPEDPFPVDDTFKHITLLQADVKTTNLVLEAGSAEAEETARWIDYQSHDNSPERNSFFFPYRPMFFETVNSTLLGEREVVERARLHQAAYILKVAVAGGGTGGARIAFLSGLTFDVIDGVELAARNTADGNNFNQNYYPKGRQYETAKKAQRTLPQYYIQLTDPAQLWENVSDHFKLKNFLSNREFGHVITEAAMPPVDSDAYRLLAGKFPYYIPVAVVHTVRRMEEARETLGGYPIKLESGYRSPQYPDYVGNLPGSRHLWGTAVDFAGWNNMAVNSFAPNSDYPPNIITYIYHQLLPASFSNWNAATNLFLPTSRPSLTEWTYAEPLAEQGSTGHHPHLDYGYVIDSDEETIIADNRPELVVPSPTPTAGEVPIRIIAPEVKESEKWAARQAVEALSDALHEHLKGLYQPAGATNRSVIQVTSNDDSLLQAAIRADIPTVKLQLSRSFYDQIRAGGGRQNEFARAVNAAFLASFEVKLGVITGRVLAKEPKQDAPVPLVGATVGLDIGESHAVALRLYQGSVFDVNKLYNRTQTNERGEYALYAVVPQQGKPIDGADVRIRATKIGYDTASVNYKPKPGEANQAPDLVLERLTTPGGSGSGLGVGCPAQALLNKDAVAELLALRRFRDVVLNRRRLGKQIIATYYKFGPYLAAWITSHPESRAYLTPPVRLISCWLNLIVPPEECQERR